MLLEISWGVIFKVVAAGLFTYAIFPLVLVGRDLLILKAIEKWIINSDLNSKIRICENDRWYLNNKYNKRIEVDLESNIYKLGDEIVSHNEFEAYEKGRKFHQNRFHPINSKISMKNNLIIWLTKHYKFDNFHNPIQEMRESYYEIHEKENSRHA